MAATFEEYFQLVHRPAWVIGKGARNSKSWRTPSEGANRTGSRLAWRVNLVSRGLRRRRERDSVAAIIQKPRKS